MSESGCPNVSVCPSGQRGYVQVVMYSYSWVHIPQLTFCCATQHPKQQSVGKQHKRKHTHHHTTTMAVLRLCCPDWRRYCIRSPIHTLALSFVTMLYTPCTQTAFDNNHRYLPPRPVLWYPSTVCRIRFPLTAVWHTLQRISRDA